jgi:hypothetical protein
MGEKQSGQSLGVSSPEGLGFKKSETLFSQSDMARSSPESSSRGYIDTVVDMNFALARGNDISNL